MARHPPAMAAPTRRSPAIDYAVEYARWAGEPPAAVRDKCARWQSLMLAEWRERFGSLQPMSQSDLDQFYASSNTLIYALIPWAELQQQESWPVEFAGLVRECVPGGGKILDYGCGLAAMTLPLRNEGCALALYDLPSRHMRFLADLTRHSEDASLHVDRDEALAAGPFDCILCFHVLEHVADPCGTARELIEALRPGGTLFAAWAFPQSPIPAEPWHLPQHGRWAGAKFGEWLEGELGLQPRGGRWLSVYRKRARDAA